MRHPILFILLLVIPAFCFGQDPAFLAQMDTRQLISFADRGNLLAQERLGSMYAAGNGIAQDYVQAYKWLTLSIEGAVDNIWSNRRTETSAAMRKSLAEKMTPPQIEEAERLAKEWESNYEQKMGDRAYPSGWGVVTPKQVYGPMPGYTDRARKARISGTVLVEFVVRKDGTVGDCTILRGLGHGLDESAIKTMTTQWRFQPGTFKGKPVDVKAMAEVVFKLY